MTTGIYKSVTAAMWFLGDLYLAQHQLHPKYLRLSCVCDSFSVIFQVLTLNLVGPLFLLCFIVDIIM